MTPMIQQTLGPMELARVGAASPTDPKFGSTGIERVAESTPTHPNSLGVAWRALVPWAYTRAGLSQKAAASDLGISPQALSKQLAGTEHLSFWRMHALPQAFWQELVVALVEHFSLSLPGMSEQDRRDMEFGRSIREAHDRRGIVR